MKIKSFLFKKNQTILFEGDSLTNRRMNPCLDTWPFLQMMNWQYTYADEMAKVLFCLRPDLNLKFRNAAIGGSTINDLLDRFEKFVLPIKPDWIVMTLGGNDSRKLSLKEFKDKVIKYIKRAKKECNANIIFIGGFKICPNFNREKKGYSKRNKYYKVLKDVCKKYKCYYISIGDELKKKAEELYKQHPIHTIYSDYGHFNSVGSMIIAWLVLKKIGFKF